jgi:hypothetical protein
VATVSLQVANPTAADVTTNSKTAKAHSVTALSFDDAALTGGWTDVVYFLSHGCAVTSTTGSTFAQREQQGFMLNMEQSDVQ